MRLAALCLLVPWLTACSVLQGLRALSPEDAGMENVSGEIWVEPAMSRSQRETLLEATRTARMQLERAYGPLRTRPRLIACVTETCYKGFGQQRTRAVSFGDSAILLSPRGLTAGFIAHEWSHAELYARLGGATGALCRDMPRWFDEGLAVVLSEDPDYGESAYQRATNLGLPMPGADELRTRAQWQVAVGKYGDALRGGEPGATHPPVTYAAAGHWVREWYACAGPGGLAHLIAAVAAGAPFDTSWRDSARGAGCAREAPAATIPEIRPRAQ